MSKIYNIAFRMGVLFNILLFTVLNLMTFFETRKNFIAMENSGIRAYPAYGWRWGFPFPMFNYDYFFIDGFVLIFNAIVYIVCGFFFGFLFKFVWSKISQRRIELK
jgi:hypothetical protein